MASLVFVGCARQTGVGSYHRLQSLRTIKTNASLFYREDYHRLGVSENASLEEIKSAYFRRAKELHPDTNESVQDSAEFISLTESYKRLIFEQKIGDGSIDADDPRNDPRRPEYWDIRKRTMNAEDIQNQRAHEEEKYQQDKRTMVKVLFAIALGLFFGQVFPLGYISSEDQVEACECDKCIMKRYRAITPIVQLKGKKKDNILKSTDSDVESVQNSTAS